MIEHTCKMANATDMESELFDRMFERGCPPRKCIITEIKQNGLVKARNFQRKTCKQMHTHGQRKVKLQERPVERLIRRTINSVILGDVIENHSQKHAY